MVPGSLNQQDGAPAYLVTAEKLHKETAQETGTDG
jgi:hypothetical protein